METVRTIIIAVVLASMILSIDGIAEQNVIGNAITSNPIKQRVDITDIQKSINKSAYTNPNTIDYNKAPMYIWVNHLQDSVFYCIEDCESEGQERYFFPVSVHVTDIHFKNWKKVPVRMMVGGWCSDNTYKYIYNETENTDNNGDARFVLDFGITGWPCTNNLGLSIIATSPKSGRSVYYGTAINIQ